MNDHEDKLQPMPEPIADCDAFRGLASVCTVDPRYASRGVIDADGRFHPMKFEEHRRNIDALALHNGVPSPIRVHFDTARNLLLHSWFVFRFQQVAEMHAYASVEYALRKRAGLPLRGRKRRLRALLKQAAEEGWIRAEGFRRFREAAARRAEYGEMEVLATGKEPDPNQGAESWYVRMLADLLPEFRNKLAHGSALMGPSGKRTLAICCDLINQLFHEPLEANGDRA
jgi:PAS domain-containing protein